MLSLLQRFSACAPRVGHHTESNALHGLAHEKSNILAHVTHIVLVGIWFIPLLFVKTCIMYVIELT